jgi:general secretion pathway protein K
MTPRHRQSPARRQRGGRFSEKGIALLAAVAAVAIIGVLVAEFSTNSTIDLYASTNTRDEMRAHFLARSGQNLGHLVIRVQTDVMDKYRKYLGDIQLADYVGLFMGAFGGGHDEVNDLAALIGGTEGESIKGLGLDEGAFDIDITTDDNKINLNCANGGQQTRDNLKTKLEALFYFEAFNPVFENPDAEGYHRDRALQVSALIDYIDTDRYKLGAPGTPEDYGYESLRDKYKAKDNYIDSVGELKLVRGVDDRFWSLFGDQFTIYGGCKENLGALQDPRLIAPIIFLSAENPDDPVLRDMTKLWALAQRVAGARAFGVFFDDLNAFADFVKNPDGALGELLAGSGADPAMAASAMGPGYVPIEGVVLNITKLGQIARTGPRRTYRIISIATVGYLTKRIVSVWDTNTQNQNPRSASYAKGAWVFWREE